VFGRSERDARPRRVVRVRAASRRSAAARCKIASFKFIHLFGRRNRVLRREIVARAARRAAASPRRRAASPESPQIAPRSVARAVSLVVMADVDLVKNIFGSDSEDDDDGDRVATESLENRDDRGRESTFKSSLELPDDAENDEDDPATRAKGEPLRLELPSAEAGRETIEDETKIAKLSNIFGAEPKPFDAATHRDDGEREEFVDVDGVTRIRTSNENTVRWRMNESTGEAESNAYYVRWDDGTTHLVVGDEYLRCDERPVADADSFLYVRKQGLMKAQRRLTTKMTFNPATLDSRTHKRLTAAIDKKHGSRATRTMAYVSRVDPEREKEALDAELERAARESAALERKQAKMMREDRERTGMWSAGGRNDRGYTESYYERRDDAGGDVDAEGGAARMDADFLEAEENDGAAGSDGAGAMEQDVAAGSLDEDEDEAVGAPKERKKRALVVDDEEDE